MRTEEETDIDELPESERAEIARQADEQARREADFSSEERYARRLEEARELLATRGCISTCTIQRYLYTSYQTASRLIYDMKEAGLITPAPGRSGLFVPAQAG